MSVLTLRLVKMKESYRFITIPQLLGLIRFYGSESNGKE